MRYWRGWAPKQIDELASPDIVIVPLPALFLVAAASGSSPPHCRHRSFIPVSGSESASNMFLFREKKSSKILTPAGMSFPPPSGTSGTRNRAVCFRSHLLGGQFAPGIGSESLCHHESAHRRPSRQPGHALPSVVPLDTEISYLGFLEFLYSGYSLATEAECLVCTSRFLVVYRLSSSTWAYHVRNRHGCQILQLIKRSIPNFFTGSTFRSAGRNSSLCRRQYVNFIQDIHFGPIKFPIEVAWERVLCWTFEGAPTPLSRSACLSLPLCVCCRRSMYPPTLLPATASK